MSIKGDGEGEPVRFCGFLKCRKFHARYASKYSFDDSKVSLTYVPIEACLCDLHSSEDSAEFKGFDVESGDVEGILVVVGDSVDFVPKPIVAGVVESGLAITGSPPVGELK